jgi:CubicO group peptidase (beta-lactamase class C family)
LAFFPKNLQDRKFPQKKGVDVLPHPSFGEIKARIGAKSLPKLPYKTLAISLVILMLTISIRLIPAAASAGDHLQVEYEEELLAYLRTQMEAYKIPGMSIAIVREGEVEYLNGLGIANAGGAAVTPQTPFLLASVSKSITAVGIMQLVEEGRINLEDPVRKYLPWFAVSAGSGREMTVADLLYQTSGLSELGGLRANLSPDGRGALEAGIRNLVGEKLQFNPGEGWEYSNLNYALLGLLIQEVSNQRYEEYVEEHIFGPLEMQDSYASLTAARAGGAASGYYPFFGIPLVFDAYMPYSRATLPAAGLWSSASDMSRYLLAHLAGGRFGGISILSHENILKLHEPGYMFNEEQGYAMGWTINHGFMPRERLEAIGSNLKDQGSLTVLFHEGDWINYKSMAFLIPELEYGVVLLMNSNDPAVLSAFRFFAWDVTLIATGGEAQYFPPAESFLVRNSRWISGVILLLLAVGLVWSLRTLKKLRWGEHTAGAEFRMVFSQAVLPLLMVIALIGYIFLKFLPDNNASLPVLIRFAPDLGILILLILLLSAGWGLVLIAFMGNARRRPEKANL